jgi:HEAT repeats
MTDGDLQPTLPDPVAVLRAAIRAGASADLAVWAATGEAGLIVLRGVLSGTVDLDLDGVHPKDVIDELSTAVAAIARAHPAAFLEVFADPGFDTDSFVVTGLGYVDDPRATERLARVAHSDERLRMEAAIGLGRHRSALAVQSLIALLSDRAYLVRYHALRGLASVGDQSAVVPLRRLRGVSKVERDLAKQALERIAARDDERPTRRAPPPLTSPD